MDALSLLADEVALEGLDGITLPSLWTRLQKRQPKFPLQLDEPTKELLWRSLSSDPDMKFYQNPEERDDIVLFDRRVLVSPSFVVTTHSVQCILRWFWFLWGFFFPKPGRFQCVFCISQV